MTHRRKFLQSLGSGFGLVALQHLLNQDGYGAAAVDPMAPRPPQFPGKAKRVLSNTPYNA